MDGFLEFIGTIVANVIAGVITYHICKSLDNDEKGDEIGKKHEG